MRAQKIFIAVICASFGGLALGFTRLSPIVFSSLDGAATRAPSGESSRAYRTSLAALSDSERVVLTGLGVVSGCGSEIPKFWDNVKGGKSSVKRIERFDLGTFPINCEVASEVVDFEPKEWFTNVKSVRSNDRYTHFAVAASKMAMKDANLEIGEGFARGAERRHVVERVTLTSATRRLGGRLAPGSDDRLRLWRRRDL